MWCFISLLAACSFPSQSLLLFVRGQRHISMGKGEQKYVTKKVIKFPNQSTLLTLLISIKWKSIKECSIVTAASLSGLLLSARIKHPWASSTLKRETKREDLFFNVPNKRTQMPWAKSMEEIEGAGTYVSFFQIIVFCIYFCWQFENFLLVSNSTKISAKTKLFIDIQLKYVKTIEIWVVFVAAKENSKR